MFGACRIYVEIIQTIKLQITHDLIFTQKYWRNLQAQVAFQSLIKIPQNHEESKLKLRHKN